MKQEKTQGASTIKLSSKISKSKWQESTEQLFVNMTSNADDSIHRSIFIPALSAPAIQPRRIVTAPLFILTAVHTTTCDVKGVACCDEPTGGNITWVHSCCQLSTVSTRITSILDDSAPDNLHPLSTFSANAARMVTLI